MSTTLYSEKMSWSKNFINSTKNLFRGFNFPNFLPFGHVEPY
uniref:Uncharacterized protein n=1 Tax=Amphimedon queenslandica TaxID=400682 RepID=A0A1X7VUI9_AMPQE